MFKGAITALITPFKDGKVDEDAFQRLVDWQISEGVHGLVPCGTTGESPTLSHDEHKKVVELCVEAASGRVPVIAGAGSNSTVEAVMLANHAKKAGADGILIVSPYYNKPSQEGIYQHFQAINNAVEVPIVVYNIPGRSVVDISDKTIARIAELQNVVGIKDATGDLSRVGSLLQELGGKEFDLLSGDDGTAVGFNAEGGVGCISVTSNVAPGMVAAVQNAMMSNNFELARKLHHELIELHTVMFCEPNPCPAKYAASLIGICSDDVRLPLLTVTNENRANIKNALSKLKIV